MPRQHQPSCSIMVPFGSRQAANDRQVFHLLRDARQMLADLNAGHRRLDGLRRSAVRVSDLQIKRVRLRWTSSHPEKNERLVLAPRLRRLSQSRQPAGIRDAESTGKRQLDEIASGEISW